MASKLAEATSAGAPPAAVFLTAALCRRQPWRPALLLAALRCMPRAPQACNLQPLFHLLMSRLNRLPICAADELMGFHKWMPAGQDAAQALLNADKLSCSW